MIKLKVHEKSLSYSKIRRQQTKQCDTVLEQTITKLEEEAYKRNFSDAHFSHLSEEINERKFEFEKIIEDCTKGAILRSKTKWYNEGENNTYTVVPLEFSFGMSYQTP